MSRHLLLFTSIFLKLIIKYEQRYEQTFFYSQCRKNEILQFRIETG